MWGVHASVASCKLGTRGGTAAGVIAGTPRASMRFWASWDHKDLTARKVIAEAHRDKQTLGRYSRRTLPAHSDLAPKNFHSFHSHFSVACSTAATALASRCPEGAGNAGVSSSFQLTTEKSRYIRHTCNITFYKSRLICITNYAYITIMFFISYHMDGSRGRAASARCT